MTIGFPVKTDQELHDEFARLNDGDLRVDVSDIPRANIVDILDLIARKSR